MLARLKTLPLFVLCFAVLPGWAQEPAPALSSSLDYSLNASRDHPVTCKPGDLQRHSGRTLGEVFGADWPLQPAPETDLSHEPAEVVEMPSLGPDSVRGLPLQQGLVVAAVLVDGSGEALQVEPICATTTGYDTFVKRVLKRAVYRPARLNGAAITSVAIVVHRFGGRS